MDATIHLVRHGEVENPKGVIYGRMPGYHLSERGRRQAQTAADRLRDRSVGAVWSSPLERAQETAQAIAARHDAEITLDERLLESKSTFEGVGRTIAALFKSPRHWWLLRNPFKPSWGESFAEIRLRMLAAIDDAVEAATEREVVVVSHQTPLIVARLSLARSRMPPWIGFTPCHVGSITTLVIEDGTVVSASYFAPPG
jgi:broad specificity phosphatase PhoE